MIDWDYLLAKYPACPRIRIEDMLRDTYPKNAGETKTYATCPQSEITPRVVKIKRKVKKRCSTTQ